MSGCSSFAMVVRRQTDPPAAAAAPQVKYSTRPSQLASPDERAWHTAPWGGCVCYRVVGAKTQHRRRRYGGAVLATVVAPFSSLPRWAGWVAVLRRILEKCSNVLTPPEKDKVGHRLINHPRRRGAAVAAARVSKDVSSKDGDCSGTRISCDVVFPASRGRSGSAEAGGR